MLSIRVRENFGQDASEVRGAGARLAPAMREATAEAVEVLEAAVESTIVDRTNMSDAVVSRIVESELDPSVGDISRGRVRLTDPPARFYPRKAKALRFTINGREIVRRSVKGSRPYKLVPRGAARAERAIEETYERHVRGALD